MGDPMIADIDKSGVKRGKVHTFTKDIIRRKALSMMNINKCVSLRTLKEELKEKDVKIRKFMSMKCLHELEFCYGKLMEWDEKG